MIRDIEVRQLSGEKKIVNALYSSGYLITYLRKGVFSWVKSQKRRKKKPIYKRRYLL
jgi:hypothetical protein